MLETASRFIDTRVECVGTRQKQDIAINPYFGQAIAMLVNAMEAVDKGGASQELPIIARGTSGIRTTATVNFHGRLVDCGPDRNSARLMSENEMMKAKIAPDNKLDGSRGRVTLKRACSGAGRELTQGSEMRFRPSHQPTCDCASKTPVTLTDFVDP